MIRRSCVACRYVSVRGFWVSPYVEAMGAAEKKELFTYTMKLLEEKVIEPFTGLNFKLSEFADAVKKQNVSTVVNHALVAACLVSVCI